MFLTGYYQNCPELTMSMLNAMNAGNCWGFVITEIAACIVTSSTGSQKSFVVCLAYCIGSRLGRGSDLFLKRKLVNPVCDKIAHI